MGLTTDVVDVWAYRSTDSICCEYCHSLATGLAKLKEIEQNTITLATSATMARTLKLCLLYFLTSIIQKPLV